MRRLTLVVVALAAACDLPPAPPPPPDLAERVSFDGGQPADAHFNRLGGNELQLDGGDGLAAIWFSVTDDDTGFPTPARVIFRPPPGAGFADNILAGHPDPKSPGSYTGAVVSPGVLGSTEGVMLVNGQGVVPVPPGTYELFITRGPEYEAVDTTVTLWPGAEQTVNATLVRSVDTRGWLAADMHVHATRSPDSSMPMERRVIAEVSSGVELIVPTDHNVNTDLAPTIQALGYSGDLVGSVVGNEFNFRLGHASAIPVPFSSSLKNGGAPPWQPLNPSTLMCDPPIFGINCYDTPTAFDMMRAQVPQQTVIVITHPYWPNGDLGYFTNIQWGAGTTGGFGPLDSIGHFDALEILNGYKTRADVESALVADWFNLLGQGQRVTALGNSDTHKINWVRSGFPRSWLRLPTDKPGMVDGATLTDAIRNQRAIASTGPFVNLTVDGAQIGDTVVPQTMGQVTITLTVDAPAWISVDRVRLYINGVMVQSWPITPTQRPLFAQTFTQALTAGQDAWIVAFASGSTPMPDDVVGEYSAASGYHMLPWAITNPVFIDGNGDGAWTPPPTPARELPTPVNQMVKPLAIDVPQTCDPSEKGEPASAPPPAEQVLMPLLF